MRPTFAIQFQTTYQDSQRCCSKVAAASRLNLPVTGGTVRHETTDHPVIHGKKVVAVPKRTVDIMHAINSNLLHVDNRVSSRLCSFHLICRVLQAFSVASCSLSIRRINTASCLFRFSIPQFVAIARNDFCSLHDKG